MLRIAHISDLHIRDDSANNDRFGLLGRATRGFLDNLGIHVEAGGHDPVKLDALLARLRALSPKVVVITGDITNFGDKASFELASSFIKKVGELPSEPKILCVPGNHDALAERAVIASKRSGLRQRVAFRIAKFFSPEVMTAERAGLGDYFLNSWRPHAKVELLQNYYDFCRKNKLPECDPSLPVDIDLAWGTVRFFLFNSVNGPGLMANKGLIGAGQIQRAVDALERPSPDSHDGVVRIALLHHHPVCAPLSNDDSTNRFYDWMEDGPLFLDFLNRRGFHFVLHGHQHEPYLCSVEYGLAESRKTMIVAAGSASQMDEGNKPSNSFNVLDFISPFQARVCRHDYAVGEFKPEAQSRVVELAAIDQVKLDNSTDFATVENWALQSLITNSFRDLDTLGSDFEYEELHFDVEITKKQLYKGRYRRCGTVRKQGGVKGPIFIITGSPAMSIVDMALEAFEYAEDGHPHPLGRVLVLKDAPNLKILQVQMRSQLAVDERFDIELRFQWQASEVEPNSFDAFSLMGFLHPVSRVHYRVQLPWRAAQVALNSVGAGIKHVEGVRPVHEDLGDENWRYSFELNNPAPVAYVFRFPKE